MNELSSNLAGTNWFINCQKSTGMNDVANHLFSINWQQIFIPSASVSELILRGTLVYLVLFILLRVVQKRQAGAVGITDLLLLVLLADATQNGMAGSYVSVTEAVILVSTITFWNYLFNWLGMRYPWFQRLIYPPPLLLVKEGRMLSYNMRRELITRDELMSQLRQQGLKDVEEVQEAYMESDGSISVIPYRQPNQPRKRNRSAI